MHRPLCLSAALILLLLVLLPQPTVAGFALDGMECLDCHAEVNEKKVIHSTITDSDSCTMCHAQDNPDLHGFAPFAANIGAAVCAMCHDDFSGRGERHYPVAEGECLSCHDPHQSDLAALLIRPQGELCLDCHGAFEGPLIHGPVKEGNCAGCHDPHAAEQKNLLRAAQPELCFTCHDRRLISADGRTLAAIKPIFEGADQLHHFPFSDGRCSDCHLPHAGDHSRLLNAPYPDGVYAVYSEEAYGFCFQCHDPDAFATLQTTAATGFRNGGLNLHYRHVNRAKGRVCGTCHSGHAATQPHLLRPSFTFGKLELGQSFTKTPDGGSCATLCHLEVSYNREQGVNNRLRTSPLE